MIKALVCVDYINDIVTEGGKLAPKGYAAFVTDHKTIRAARLVQDKYRAEGAPLIHVRIGFESRYLALPRTSPLFKGAESTQALTRDAWGTDFADGVGPEDGELIVDKPRISGLYGTELGPILRALHVEELVIFGVATDLAVLGLAFDAHDQDFAVSVVQDACAAANEGDHQAGLGILRKIANVVDSADL